MDFGSVLYTAHKNEKSANKDVKCYKTKFDPPKKEAKPAKPNLSANIQKYLQKREDEERKKADEEKKKKEELLALRSQDKKAFKRVQTMLKRTKSANKSVMEDAIDEVNTVVTMAGPQQCDEDDYGYVSKEASDFYSKMMDKYANMPPEEPKFSQSKKSVPKDLNAAKDRVRAALQRVEEEEMMPHKRKRKSKGDKNDEENGEEDGEDRRKGSRDHSPVEEPKQKKPKKMAPPPIDFSSLLKLAEQKQYEPITIEKKVEDKERPMTKRQRLEYERELESRRRKEEREAMRLAALNKNSKSSDISDRREKHNGLGRIPKKSNASDNRSKQEKPVENTRRNSVNSDDEQHNSSNYCEKQKSNYSTDTRRNQNPSYNSGNNPRKETSILKSTLLKTDDRKPLKPTQPSIASNKIKSRTHNISDGEQSDASDSGYEKSRRYSSNNHSTTGREHNSERQKESSRKPSTGLERSYSDRNSQKKYSNVDNECTDSQSSNDSRKYQPSKSHSSSESNRHKYKPEVKYKPDMDRNKLEEYKPSYPEKQSSKKFNNFSNGRGRSNSPQHNKYSNDRYSHDRKQSCSESEPEDENRYKPSKKGNSSYKNFREKEVETDERSQSPYYSNNNNKRKDSYSEIESDHATSYEPPKKKLSTNKVKKISSLFEGSDDERSSNHDIVRSRNIKESENRKPKSSIQSDRQKESENKRSKSFVESEKQKPSSDSKFKTPKISDSEKSKFTGNDRYKASANSKPPSSSSSRPSSKDIHRPNQENSKSDRSQFSSKSDGDRSRVSTNKNNNNLHPSVESSKTDPKENTKKPSSQNTVEILKKSASVWSKPCNASPANSAPKLGGLSESQLQRLREMNKKPTPTRPLENRTSLSGRPSPRDERKSDGRPTLPKPGPSQSKQSFLMKAAAERGAMVKAQLNSSRSNESSPRPTQNKSLTKPSSSNVSRSTDATKDARPKQGDMKPKQFPPSDLKPKQFPPSDLKPRQFPPKDVRPRQFPPPDVRRRPKPRRIEDDSEEEYDSDMDSFIDDGSDLRPEDISREIQQIFGYDKSRYAGMDDDDECMESNFGQIDREELRSLRIGAKEDYEELMRDLERKKRAKQRKQMEKGRR